MRKKKVLSTVLNILKALLIIIISYGLSWLITIIVLKFISICLELKFSLKAATGIWLVLKLFECTFNGSEVDKLFDKMSNMIKQK